MENAAASIDLFNGFNIGIKDEDKESCPKVYIAAYENLSDYVVQTDNYYENARTSPNSSPDYDTLYNGLYKKGNLIANYIFPYFNDKPFSYTSEYTPINSEDSPGLWAQKAGFSFTRGLVNGTEDFIANVGGALGADWLSRYAGESHRTGKRQAAQSIKAFSRGTGAEYGTKFSLFNEKDSDIEQNHEFIIHFLKLLAPTYPNVMMMKVPCIFEIEIPSIVKYPHGFIGNFTASPSGTSKMMNGIIAPNAWIINMSFNSLTPVSTQSLDLIKP